MKTGAKVVIGLGIAGAAAVVGVALLASKGEGDNGGSTASIDGYVKDSQGMPIGGAIVNVEGPYTLTDSLGYYRIDNLVPRDVVAVRASRLGYITQTQYTRLEAGGVTHLNFYLLPEVTP